MVQISKGSVPSHPSSGTIPNPFGTRINFINTHDYRIYPTLFDFIFIHTMNRHRRKIHMVIFHKFALKKQIN